MEPQLHVLHILPYLETGGTEKHVLTLISTLRQLNLCSGEVLAPPGPFAQEMAQAGIQVSLFPSPTTGVFPSYRGFRRLFRSLAPAANVIHVHGAPDLLLFAALTRASRCPRVLTIHGFHGQGAKASYRFAALIGNRLADAMICVAGSEERLLAAAGVRRQILHRIYNGVADPAPGSGSAQTHHNLNQHGAGDVVRVAFIGRLSPVKGVDVLLQALAMLKEDTNPPITLQIMGVGDEAVNLKRQAEELGVADQVAFMGYCPDAAARLAECDIFCLPSREDMGPLVCVEAMAQAKPIVSTLVGGIPEMVQDGKTGLLVPPGDATALAKAIARLAQDALLRQTMGAAGRQRYENLYTQESMARSTYKVYQAILQNAE